MYQMYREHEVSPTPYKLGDVWSFFAHACDEAMGHRTRTRRAKTPVEYVVQEKH